MDHNDVNCQYPFKRNPNTSKFWDGKIIKNKAAIQLYPIYRLKNNYVIKRLKKISGNFLDVGLGYGLLEKEILDRKLDLDLFGIDISKVAVKSATKNLDGEFKKASIQSIPYNDNFFDCVVALDIIEHLSIESVKESINEIYRVTKKNGLIIVSVPTNETSDDRINNGHLIEYDVDGITNLLVRSGFVIEKIKLFSAFKNLTYLKNLINRIIRVRKPNLIIVTAFKR